MSGFLIDTNVPSETFKDRPELRLLKWLEEVGDELLFISVISIAEVYSGIAHLPESAKRDRLEAWVAQVLRPWFADRILPITEPIAQRLGIWTGEGKKRGVQIPMGDGLIASTAVEHGLTVVTRNVRDFAWFDVPILNPWD